MNVTEFKEKTDDVLDMFDYKEVERSDTVEHLKVLALKLALSTCDDYRDLVKKHLAETVSWTNDAQKAFVMDKIEKTPFPDHLEEVLVQRIKV